MAAQGGDTRRVIAPVDAPKRLAKPANTQRQVATPGKPRKLNAATPVQHKQQQNRLAAPVQNQNKPRVAASAKASSVSMEIAVTSQSKMAPNVAESSSLTSTTQYLSAYEKHMQKLKKGTSARPVGVGGGASGTGPVGSTSGTRQPVQPSNAENRNKDLIHDADNPMRPGENAQSNTNASANKRSLDTVAIDKNDQAKRLKPLIQSSAVSDRKLREPKRRYKGVPQKELRSKLPSDTLKAIRRIEWRMQREYRHEKYGDTGGYQAKEKHLRRTASTESKNEEALVDVKAGTELSSNDQNGTNAPSTIEVPSDIVVPSTSTNRVPSTNTTDPVPTDTHRTPMADLPSRESTTVSKSSASETTTRPPVDTSPANNRKTKAPPRVVAPMSSLEGEPKPKRKVTLLATPPSTSSLAPPPSKWTTASEKDKSAPLISTRSKSPLMSAETTNALFEMQEKVYQEHSTPVMSRCFETLRSPIETNPQAISDNRGGILPTPTLPSQQTAKNEQRKRPLLGIAPAGSPQRIGSNNPYVGGPIGSGSKRLSFESMRGVRISNFSQLYSNVDVQDWCTRPETFYKTKTVSCVKYPNAEDIACIVGLDYSVRHVHSVRAYYTS